MFKRYLLDDKEKERKKFKKIKYNFLNIPIDEFKHEYNILPRTIDYFNNYVKSQGMKTSVCICKKGRFHPFVLTCPKEVLNKELKSNERGDILEEYFLQGLTPKKKKLVSLWNERNNAEVKFRPDILKVLSLGGVGQALDGMFENSQSPHGDSVFDVKSTDRMWNSKLPEPFVDEVVALTKQEYNLIRNSCGCVLLTKKMGSMYTNAAGKEIKLPYKSNLTFVAYYVYWLTDYVHIKK